MGNKNVSVGSHVQATVHHISSGKVDTDQHAIPHQPPWNPIYHRSRNNYFQMGEAIRMTFNLIGGTTFILGILANLNNLLSVALACVGIVWGIVKCMEKYEDYRLKKWEREQRQEEQDRKKKVRKAS